MTTNNFHRRDDANTAPQSRFPVRELSLLVVLAIAVSAVFMVMGSAYSTRMLVEASCYAILALGLTIQWGYAGQFNAGVMGFVALGGFCAMTFSVPVNPAFWDSSLPGELARVLAYVVAGIALVFGLSRLTRLGLP
ncbi:MAG: branched-chain amino acid ABC transporter permease, partial [Pseudomonadota bacterium]|nr:branched-chain amino acid ABC transporter permease [Pseudomonadota bacterium]